MSHPLTWRQYSEARAREIAGEHGCTIAEAWACTPFYRRQWERECEEYAAAGGVFRSAWLNTLNRTHRFMLAKHYRGSIPRHYVMPENRYLVENAP